MQRHNVPRYWRALDVLVVCMRLLIGCVLLLSSWRWALIYEVRNGMLQ
jgi:hypothetical protein